jgi:ABC-2 type transport system ATP-binding protein
MRRRGLARRGPPEAPRKATWANAEPHEYRIQQRSRVSPPPVITAVGLTKVFQDFWHRARVKAVSDVDLVVQPGEIFGLLGPNGSGKSTTIKMILGLLYPTRGRVTVFGRPPEDVRTKALIGYLPEESYLYRFLNARETLDYYGTLFQLPRRERKRRTEELLEMVGLRSAARRPVGEYSKGMARRIGLAQALMNDPDLLILDEPTSGLDPIGSKLVKDIILRIGHELRKTILLSSHLLADVEEVCSRVTILYGGRVQTSGRIEDVLSRGDMTQITCDRLSSETIREIELLVQRRHGATLSVTTPRDRLESLFLRIVETASAQRVETAGSAAAGEIAGFLGETKGGEQVLEALVRFDAAEAVAPEAATPRTAPPAEDVLADLAEPGGAAPTSAAAQPVGEALAKPDRSVLDQLTQDEAR